MCKPLRSHTAALAAVFSFCSLGIEGAVKLGGFIFQVIGVGRTATFATCIILSLAATVGAYMCTLPVEAIQGAQPAKQPVKRRRVVVMGAVSLWPDARIWLLCFLPMALIASETLWLDVVSSRFVTPGLGSKYADLFSAVIPLVGAAVQYPIRYLADKCGKGSVFALGSLLLILGPGLASMLHLQSIGWWLITFYILHGAVAGIREATSNAIYADLFPHPTTEPAFANRCMQEAIMTTVLFLLESDLSAQKMAMVVMGFAFFIIPGYVAANLDTIEADLSKDQVTDLESHTTDMEMGASISRSSISSSSLSSSSSDDDSIAAWTVALLSCR